MSKYNDVEPQVSEKSGKRTTVKLKHEFLLWEKLPPPSTPRATGHNPEATTAADPLEEPPEILLRLYGFLVALQDSR